MYINEDLTRFHRMGYLVVYVAGHKRKTIRQVQNAFVTSRKYCTLKKHFYTVLLLHNLTLNECFKMKVPDVYLPLVWWFVSKFPIFSFHCPSGFSPQ